MASVTVSRGVGTKVVRTYGVVRDMKSDAALWQFIGADPESSQIYVGGQVVGDDQTLLEGDVLDVRDVAHTKGN